MTVTVYRPDGDVLARPARLTAPVGSLAGAVIGVLDNGKPNADTLLGRVAARLAERTGAVVVAPRSKNAAVPCEDQVLEGMQREVTVVLTGSAD